MRFPPKDPDATLDYRFDWKAKTNGTGRQDYLQSGETIVSHSIIASSGITIESSGTVDSDTAVIVWVSGGTAGQTYTLTCRITTSDDRTDDRTASLPVEPT
jgi:hypothetical protein